MQLYQSSISISSLLKTMQSAHYNKHKANTEMIVSISQFYRNYSMVLSRQIKNVPAYPGFFFHKEALRISFFFAVAAFAMSLGSFSGLDKIYRNINMSHTFGICGPFFILFDSVPSDVIQYPD